MKAISHIASAVPVSAALFVDLKAKALAAGGQDIVSFCVGEPDASAPVCAQRAGLAAIESGDTRYTPAAGTFTLRDAIASALMRDFGLAYDPAAIAVTTGAKYAVYAAALAILDPGDEVVLPAPYWTSYYHILHLTGARPVVVSCRAASGWKLWPAQLEAAITPRTKALILNNPNNPTGAVYSRKELEALAAVCRRYDLYVLADEIYSRLIYTDAPFCAAATVNDDMRARTLTIGGVSKTYAMTGWRIGYVAGDKAPIDAVGAILSHTTGSPNTPAQAAACAALLGPQQEAEQMRRRFRSRRDALVDALRGVPGLRFDVPQGAFYVLLDIRGALKEGRFADEADFAMQLLNEEGVATVPCADYGAPGCLRLSYTLEEARILEGVRRLGRFMERKL